MASIGTTTATLACFLLLLSTPFTPYAEDPSINCSDVEILVPCLGYVTGKAKAPASSCCLGVQHFYTTAGSTAESHTSVCECFKEEAKGHRDLKPERVSKLPSVCLHTKKYPFKLSLDMDCSDLHQ
ncbi:hypothetical protein H6P81_017278 [Aristolochia fimbriata]|uniref:Bifunctional inhibitor/plant lipid transfer protein/seed storage helical domain-containing protein n=1 Tax=Aristolochia fimbriata TaxID=158543 RepID=A0AAV7DY08_ARIFI|nr:hypothetical protein H6P81_017278 [Aristolochia fimbriata]